MPIYEGQGKTREDLKHLCKYHRCVVCSARLAVFFSMKEEKAFLACEDWRRTQHDGIERQPSRYEMEGLASLNIPRRREIMVHAYGETKANALEKYQGGGQLTKDGAMEVLRLVYPDCPDEQIVRTAILCRDFGLHPLMKEVYLIPFEKRDKSGNVISITWATVIGITANRKIASARKGGFSFLDDTPRAATQEEVTKQFGPNSQEAGDNLISICRLMGERGNTASGFGLWPTNKEPKGTNKGNTQRNMANIRSERQALDRLPGEAMPLKGVEVMDEAYIQEPVAIDATFTTESGEVDKATGEIVEPAPVNIQAAKPEHWCEEHNCRYDKKVRGSSVWYAHKLADGWCNELKKKGSQAVQASIEPSVAPSTIDMDWLAESLKKVKWDDKTAASWLISKFNVQGGTLPEVLEELTLDQVKEFVKEIQERLEMA